jgi:hypothetical protein
MTGIVDGRRVLVRRTGNAGDIGNRWDIDSLRSNLNRGGVNGLHLETLLARTSKKFEMKFETVVGLDRVSQAVR